MAAMVALSIFCELAVSGNRDEIGIKSVDCDW